MSFSFYLHSKITTKLLDEICLCFGSRGVFIFSFWFFFIKLSSMARGSLVFFIHKILFNLKKAVVHMGSSMVFGRHVRRYLTTKLWPPRRCFNHHNIASIPMQWVWQKYVGFCAGGFFFFILSFLFLGFKANPYTLSKQPFNFFFLDLIYLFLLLFFLF